MKNATPSDKRKALALERIDSLEIEVIAEKYRKIGGIKGHQFDFLIDEDDWTSLPLRKEFVDEIINEKPGLKKAFVNFRKFLAKKYPEYKYLIEREDWTFPLQEMFLFGDIQHDTEIPFGNISWLTNDDTEKALYLKILPGADKKQVIDFLDEPSNNIVSKFKRLGVVIPKIKARLSKSDAYKMDLWVRVLDTFSNQEIRKTFAVRYPKAYTEKFMLNGKRKALERAKEELIAHYVFHRFGLKKPDGKAYSPNYVKSILKKARDNKTEVKLGSFKEIP